MRLDCKPIPLCAAHVLLFDTVHDIYPASEMSLNVYQQVFGVSLASNLVNRVKGSQTSLQAALKLGVIAALPTIGAEWQLVWGPVVWKHEPENAETGPDNSWYIAFHPSLQFDDGTVHPTYVVGVAGTPPESLYVWFKQNLAVNTVADFKAWVAGGIQNSPVQIPSSDVVESGAYIATGTVNAVHVLLNTAAPEGAASAGTTLLDFITNVNRSASPKFITTGHSLGGALSPSLALALTLSGATPADNTLTYATAGASPGNVGFTDLFVQTLPPRKSAGASSYQGWNLNLVNTLDVVPQAWCSVKSLSPEQFLGNIPPIYGKPIIRNVWITTLLGVLWSRSSGTLYKPLPSQFFTGPPPATVPTTLAEFLEINSPQHIEAYLGEIGLRIPSLEQSRVPRVGLKDKTVGEIRSDWPFIIDLEWAREHPKEAEEIGEKVEATAEAKGFVGESE